MAAIQPGMDLHHPSWRTASAVIPEIGGDATLDPATIVLGSVMIFFAVGTASYRTSLAILISFISQSGLIVSYMLTESYSKRIFAQYFIAWSATFLAKSPILWLYLHLFHVKESMRYAVFASLVWATLIYLPNTVGAPLTPAIHGISMSGSAAKPGAPKWPVACAVMSVALDNYIVILPVPVVLRLKLSGRKRLGILIIFTTAFFVIVCAILTLVYRVKLLLPLDPMWLSAQLFIRNGVENYIVIIAAAQVQLLLQDTRQELGLLHGSYP